MNAKYCAECGYNMVADINGTTLWCPVCDMTKEIEKDEPDQRE